ncbi:MAG: hypothetical protein DWQ07_01300 [Chloroflexi bacterium]|nr:MAG: hypothetical protein DWQ07_01300 [Chloroflexota bacterium]MBL1193866.1 hypothetical protein [Chloroflexota bacterium]NOH11160.1 hypothetical protein [Chloroflexota bacterium]
MNTESIINRFGLIFILSFQLILSSCSREPGNSLAENELTQRNWPDQAVVAFLGVNAGEGVHIEGDVAVIYSVPREETTSSSGLVMASDVVISGEATSPTVTLQSGATIEQTVHTLEVTGSEKDIGVSDNLPVFPLPLLLPDFPMFTPGNEDVAISAEKEQSLDPGTYGSISVAPGTKKSQTTLILTGGAYDFQELNVGAQAAVLCQNPCEIRVQGGAVFENNSKLGPQDTASLSSRDIQLFVAGIPPLIEGRSVEATGATFGASCEIIANIYAPNGLLALQDRTNVTGALIGRWVELGQGVIVTGETSSQSTAQDIDQGRDLLQFANVQGIDNQIRAVRFFRSSRPLTEEVFDKYAPWLGLGPDDELIKHTSRTDQEGRLYHRYHQYHRGLKVVGVEMIVQEVDGQAAALIGRVIPNLDQDPSTKIDKIEAWQIALEAMDAQLYPWDIPRDHSAFEEIPEGELVITSKGFTYSDDSFRVAYRFEIASLDPIDSVVIDVDAHSGEIINSSKNITSSPSNHTGIKDNGIVHPASTIEYSPINAPSIAVAFGTGDTLYNGKQVFLIDTFTDTDGAMRYRLRVPGGTGQPPITTLHRIETTGLPVSTTEPEWVEVDFVSDDDDFDTWPLPDFDTAVLNKPAILYGVSVHWGLQRAVDFWKPYGWLGLDGSGTKEIKAVVGEGKLLSNVYGSTPFYDTVEDTLFFPNTGVVEEVDIHAIGHEFTHGVLDHAVSDLVNAGETIVLEEGFAAILGNLLGEANGGIMQWCGHYHPANTIIYYDDLGDGSCPPGLCPDEVCNPETKVCMQTSTADCVNYPMANPALKGLPTTYNGVNYLPTNLLECLSTDYCHINSSVVQRWFYLLAQGGKGQADFGIAYDVQPIGLQAASEILIHTMLYNFVGNSQFADARIATLTSAAGVFPGETKIYGSVANAWHAVGVGERYDPRNYSPNGVTGVEPWPASLQWSALSAEYDWQGQVSTDSTFTTNVESFGVEKSVIHAGLKSLGAEVDLLPETTYYWRIRARTSPTGTFEQPAPSDLHYSSTATFVAPAVSSSPGQLSISSGNFNNTLNPVFVDPTLSQDEGWGPWGNTQSFTTNAKVPILISPAPGSSSSSGVFSASGSNIVSSYWGSNSASASNTANAGPVKATGEYYPWDTQFTWHAMSGASQYQIMATTQAQRKCPQGNGGNPGLSLPGDHHTQSTFVPTAQAAVSTEAHSFPLKADRTYYWWLKVFGPDGIVGGCSYLGRSVQFDTETPSAKLISPAHQEHVSPFHIPLEWEVTPGATVYQLQYRPIGSSWATLLVSGTTKIISVPSEGTYEWRVRPENSSLNDVGAYSAIRTFIADLALTKPTLENPKNGDEVTPLVDREFWWSQVDGAVSYWLELFERSPSGQKGNTVALLEAGAASTTICTSNDWVCFPSSQGTTHPQGYCWEITAIGPNNLQGVVSDTACYGLRGAFPTLISPANGEKDVPFNPTTFEWTSPFAPGGYELRFAAVSDPSCYGNPLDHIPNLSPHQIDPGKTSGTFILEPDQHYCWQVRAIGLTDGKSIYATGEFWTEPGCPIITWVPVGEQIRTPPITLQWIVLDTADGPPPVDKYRIVINYQGTANSAIQIYDQLVDASSLITVKFEYKEEHNGVVTKIPAQLVTYQPIQSALTFKNPRLYGAIVYVRANENCGWQLLPGGILFGIN